MLSLFPSIDVYFALGSAPTSDHPPSACCSCILSVSEVRLRPWQGTVAALILLVKPSSSISFLWEDSECEIRKMEEFRDQHTVDR